MNQLTKIIRAAESTPSTARLIADSAIQKALVSIALAPVVAMLAGCGSSGSGHTQYFEPRYAMSGEQSFAEALTTMGDGDELNLSATLQSYHVDSKDHSASLRGTQPGGFTIRVTENDQKKNYGVTIQSPHGTFKLEDVSLLAGKGELWGVFVDPEQPEISLHLQSRYYEYVHIGLWEAIDYTGDHERIEGASFRKGFETDPVNMPASGSAVYRGNALTQVIRGGEAFQTTQGNVILNADFGSLMVNGRIEHIGLFNDIALDVGGIHDGNRFSGRAFAEHWAALDGLPLNAEGGYEGAFYGPVANEVGGTWSISQGDIIAVGAFGGSLK